MLKKSFVISLFASLFAVAIVSVAHAQTLPTISTVPSYSAGQLIGMLEAVGDWIFIGGVVIAPIMIIIGAVILLNGGGDPNKVATARRIFIWTIVGFSLMMISRGVFSVVRNIFG